MLATEKLENILDKQLLWIAAADSRLSLVLPLSTAMLGVLAAYAPKNDQWALWSGIFAAFAVLFLCLSILFCSLASFPRTNGTKGSIIFFEGIVSRDSAQYKTHVQSMDEQGYIEDLIQQCHINASVASEKFVWVKRGMMSLFISTVPWVLAVYSFYGK